MDSDEIVQLASQQKYELAYNMLSNLIEKEPQNAWAHYTAGQCLAQIDNGNSKQLDYYKTALQLQPGNVFVLGLIGNYFYLRHTWMPAIKYYNQILDIKEDIAALENRARCYVNIGQVDKAMEDWLRILSINKEDEKTENYVQNYWKRSTCNPIDLFKRLHKITGQQKYYKQIGNLYSEQGNKEQSMKYWEKYYKFNQNDEEINQKLKQLNEPNDSFQSNELNISQQLIRAKELLNGQQYQDAIQACNQLIQYQQTEEIFLILSKSYAKLKNIDEAIKTLQQSLICFPQSVALNQQLGKYYKENNQIKKAKKVFKRILQLQKNNILALVSLGEIYLFDWDQKSNQAISAFQQAQQQDSTHPNVLIGLGKCECKANNLSQAKKYFKLAIKQPLTNINAYFQLAIVYHKQNNPIKAVIYYQKYLKRDAQSKIAHFNLALVYKETNQFQDAKDHLLQAISIDHDYTQANYMLGKLFIHQLQQPKAGIDYLIKVIGQIPNHYKAFTKLGVIFSQLQDFYRAKSYFERALNLNPDYLGTYYHYGKLLIQYKDFNRAFGLFQQGLTRNQTSPYLYKGIGDCKYYLNDMTGALENYQKAIELNIDDPSVYFNLGQIYFKRQQYKDSIRNYQKSLQDSKSKLNALLSIGISYYNLNDYNHAEQNFILALKENPTNSQAIYNLALTYQSLKQFDDAIVYYQSVIKSGQFTEQSYFNLGSIYHTKGDNEEAIKSFQSCYNFNPMRWDVAYNLALLFLQKKKKSQAKYYLDITLKLNPSHSTAKKLSDKFNYN